MYPFWTLGHIIIIALFNWFIFPLPDRDLFYRDAQTTAVGCVGDSNGDGESQVPQINTTLHTRHTKHQVMK